MNILVFGTGGFGKLRAAAFARRGHSIAFASRDPERARAATRALGGAEDAGLDWADAAFVATPPACHAAPVVEVARAGKPVLVEKPVEANLARGRALEAALSEHARLVTVAENYAFLPQVPLVREALSGLGALGEMRCVLRRPRAPTGWRIDGALSGGGVLADMGVHYVHLLRLFLGDLVVETATEHARVPGAGVDAAFSLAGSSASGARWSVDLSWCSFWRASSVTLVAERGALRFRVGRDALWRPGWLGVPRDVRRVPDDPHGQEALHDAWLASVERGAPPPIPLASGLRDLAVVEDAYALASARTRR